MTATAFAVLLLIAASIAFLLGCAVTALHFLLPRPKRFGFTVTDVADE
jgi:hypothetical protein